MVVKPAPASSFIMPQAELLFQLLVIAFDDPALLGQAYQIAKLGADRQSSKPILGRFGFGPRPLEQQPFFRMGLATPAIAVRGTNPYGSETRTQGMSSSFPPSYPSPR